MTKTLKQIGYLFSLRAKMGFRILKSLGWIRTIIFLMFLGGFFVAIFQSSPDDVGLWLIILSSILLLVSIHLVRNDLYFLKSTGLNPIIIYSLEYLLLFTPIFLWVLSNGAYRAATLGLSFCFIIPRIFWKVKSRGLKKTVHFKNVPAKVPFEWISGFRDKGISLVLLLTLGLALGWIHLFSGWIVAIVITGTIISFYKHCESEEFIRLAENHSFSFLVKKIRQGISGYLLFSSILWVELLLNFSNEWTYTLLFVSANMLLLVVGITGKYTFYHEHKNIEIPLSLLFTLTVLCLVIPYMLPVLILLLIWLSVKANNRLKGKVYDIH